MSDPHVVIVGVDAAPHDSDQETRISVYQFSGPDQAREFYENAVVISDSIEEVIVEILEPEPITYVVDVKEALADLVLMLEGH